MGKSGVKKAAPVRPEAAAASPASSPQLERPEEADAAPVSSPQEERQKAVKHYTREVNVVDKTCLYVDLPELEENAVVHLKWSSEAAAIAGSALQERVNAQAQMAADAQAVRLIAKIDKLSLGSAGRDKGMVQQQRKPSPTYWSTQPVVKFNDPPAKASESIEEDIPSEDVEHEPILPPAGYEWTDLDLTNETQLHEVYTLLQEHYVDDDDRARSYGFSYSKDYLRWALLGPGHLKQWHVGVRAKAGKKLFGFIAAIPRWIRVCGVEKKMVEVRFLCLHERLREKRFAPVLMRELTRRVVLEGICQGVYTNLGYRPDPRDSSPTTRVAKTVAIGRYYVRTLNPIKLGQVKWLLLHPRTLHLYRVPDLQPIPGFRKMQKKDIGGAWQLMQQHLKAYKLAPIFTKEEFAHIFLPRDDVIYSFVVERHGKITDFCSYYSVPSTVVNCPHKEVRVAYGYYCAPGLVPLSVLVHKMLLIAQQLGFDCFSMLDLMDMDQIKEDFHRLTFGPSDGILQYFFYNWRCPDLHKSDVGLLLQ